MCAWASLLRRFADRLRGFAVEVGLVVRIPALPDDWSQVFGLREHDQLTRLSRDNHSLYILSNMFAFTIAIISSFSSIPSCVGDASIDPNRGNAPLVPRGGAMGDLLLALF